MDQIKQEDDIKGDLAPENKISSPFRFNKKSLFERGENQSDIENKSEGEKELSERMSNRDNEEDTGLFKVEENKELEVEHQKLIQAMNELDYYIYDHVNGDQTLSEYTEKFKDILLNLIEKHPTKEDYILRKKARRCLDILTWVEEQKAFRNSSHNIRSKYRKKKSQTLYQNHSAEKINISQETEPIFLPEVRKQEGGNKNGEMDSENVKHHSKKERNSNTKEKNHGVKYQSSGSGKKVKKEFDWEEEEINKKESKKKKKEERKNEESHDESSIDLTLDLTREEENTFGVKFYLGRDSEGLLFDRSKLKIDLSYAIKRVRRDNVKYE